MDLTMTDVATGTTYVDTRGSIWHATLTEDYTPALATAGNSTLRTYREVAGAFGPLTRASFTAAELATIAEALATHHDQREPLEGGPTATLRPRLDELLKRARYIESLLPAIGLAPTQGVDN